MKTDYYWLRNCTCIYRSIISSKVSYILKVSGKSTGYQSGHVYNINNRIYFYLLHPKTIALLQTTLKPTYDLCSGRSLINKTFIYLTSPSPSLMSMFLLRAPSFYFFKLARRHRRASFYLINFSPLPAYKLLFPPLPAMLTCLFSTFRLAGWCGENTKGKNRPPYSY
jgi:hypothetical protein